MEINMTEKVKVNAKTLKVNLKVRDEFYCSLVSESGKKLKDYEGYVPGFMPGEHYGDYVNLEIDIDTGQILNWKKPTAEEIESFINEDSDE